jgi:hypothetical protein
MRTVHLELRTLLATRYALVKRLRQIPSHVVGAAGRGYIFYPLML